VSSIVVDLLARSGGRTVSNPTGAESLIGDLLFDLSFVVAAIYFAALRGRPRPQDFGFRLISFRRGAAGVLLAGISYYVVTAVYASLLSLHGKDKLPSPLGTTKSTVALVGVALFVCVVAPIAEELFFRGFIFGVLRRMRIMVGGHNLGTWVAAVITGILFGLAHTGSALSQDLIPLGFLGFVLCLLRWRTGSLYPCIALHSLNNALALGITQFHWGAGEIVALMTGSLAVIGALTLPLADRLRPDRRRHKASRGRFTRCSRPCTPPTRGLLQACIGGARRGASFWGWQWRPWGSRPDRLLFRRGPPHTGPPPLVGRRSLRRSKSPLARRSWSIIAPSRCRCVR
jgi:membrane protease YdiL (CAAX protease family)